jgi:hypothetical protein
MEVQLSDLASMIKDLQLQNTSIQRTLDDNLTKLHDVGVWRSQIDAKVDGLQKSMADLQIKVDQLITHPPIVNSADCVFETVELDITKSAAPQSAASSSAAASGLLATGDPTSHRGLGHGVVTTYVPTPVKGANLIPSTVSPNFTAQQFFALNQAIPQQEFPKFDGMNPKLWKKRVEPQIATALQVAKLFMDNIFKLHDMPLALISNRDKIFTSQLWQELFRLSDTELQMSTSYHPQTDGQTERVNQCWEAYLRCTVNAFPHK